MPKSIRTLRGLKDIRTPFSTNTKRADEYYMAYQRIAALEKEKARITQEKNDLQNRMDKIESRTEEIDDEKGSLLSKLSETDPAFYSLGNNNGSEGELLQNGPKGRLAPSSNKPKKTPKVSQDIIKNLTPAPAPASTHRPEKIESTQETQIIEPPIGKKPERGSQRARPVPSAGVSGFKLKY